MQNKQTVETWKLCLLAAGLVLVIFGTAALMLDFLAIGIMGSVLAPVGLVMLLPEWNIRRFVRKSPREESVVVFSEDNVEINIDKTRTNLPWSKIQKVHIDDRGVVMLLDSNNAVFVPARAFVKGYFPRQELKRLITSKLKKSHRR
ncbi:MAG: hypothetical protein SynsKO_14430 [Synoicihabitans sp.]